MSFFAYLKDRAASVAILAAAIAFSALVLVAYGVELGIVWFVCAVLVLAAALALMLDWGRRRGFYRQLSETEDALGGRATLATELVDRPQSLDEQLFFDALDRESKAMRDAIAAFERERREYHEYVETWVHEVKTPIAAARLVAANEAGPAMERVEVELDAIDGYVEQALYYARGTSLDRDFAIRETVLADVAREAVRAHARTLIDAGVTPELGGGLDLVVRADPKWLAFVLGQLLVNAAKYRRAGCEPGHVRLWAERVDVGLGAFATRLHVADDGLGIPESDQPRVWDKGFTGQNGRRFAKSTGMGLYLVRELCRKMSLDVSLASVPGAGTDVTIVFPG